VRKTFSERVVGDAFMRQRRNANDVAVVGHGSNFLPLVGNRGLKELERVMLRVRVAHRMARAALLRECGVEERKTVDGERAG
jgi:hypothetical protein